MTLKSLKNGFRSKGSLFVLSRDRWKDKIMDSLFFRQINPWDGYKHCSIILSSRQLQVLENNLRMCLPHKPIKLLYPCSFTVAISFVCNHFKVKLKSRYLKLFCGGKFTLFFPRTFFSRGVSSLDSLFTCNTLRRSLYRTCSPSLTCVHNLFLETCIVQSSYYIVHSLPLKTINGNRNNFLKVNLFSKIQFAGTFITKT